LFQSPFVPPNQVDVLGCVAKCLAVSSVSEAVMRVCKTGLVFLLGLSVSLSGCGKKEQYPDMTQEEFTSFVEDCRDELRQKIALSVEKWKLNKFGRFIFDQEKGQIEFLDGEGPDLVCEVQIIGTYSKETRTWLWAWKSAWILDKLKDDSLKVNEFGDRHGLERLLDPKWEATEEDGWDMTAVAAHLAPAEGAYRLPNREVMIFMLLKKIEPKGATQTK
jgi:hypothetical protein